MPRSQRRRRKTRQPAPSVAAATRQHKPDYLHKLQHTLVDWLVPSLALALCAFIALPLTPFSIPFLLLFIPLIAVLGARLPLYARFSLYMFLLLLVPLLNITYIRTRDSDRYFFQCEAIDQCWFTRSADVLGEKILLVPVFDFASLGIMPFSNDALRWYTMARLFDDSRRNRFVATVKVSSDESWLHSPAERRLVAYMRDPDSHVYSTIDFTLRHINVSAIYVPDSFKEPGDTSSFSIHAEAIPLRLSMQSPINFSRPGVFSVKLTNEQDKSWLRLAENDRLVTSLLSGDRDIRYRFYHKYAEVSGDSRAFFLATALLASETDMWMKGTLDLGTRRLAFRRFITQAMNVKSENETHSDALFRFWLMSMYMLYYGEYAADDWLWYVARMPDDRFRTERAWLLEMIGDDRNSAQPVLYMVTPVCTRPEKLDWTIGEVMCKGMKGEMAFYGDCSVGGIMEVDQSRAAEIAEKPAEQYEQDVRQFVLSGGQVRGDRVRQMQASLMQVYLKPVYEKVYPLFVEILTAWTGGRDAHQVLADVYAATKDVLASVHLQEWARRTRMLNAVAAEDTNWVTGLVLQQEGVEGIVDRMQSGIALFERLIAELQAQQGTEEAEWWAKAVEEVRQWVNLLIGNSSWEARAAVDWFARKITEWMSIKDDEREAWLMAKVMPELIAAARFEEPWWSPQNELGLAILRLHAVLSMSERQEACRPELLTNYVSSLRDREGMREFMTAQQAAFMLFAACGDKRAAFFERAARSAAGGHDWMFLKLLYDARKRHDLTGVDFVVEKFKEFELPRCPAIEKAH